MSTCGLIKNTDLFNYINQHRCLYNRSDLNSIYANTIMKQICLKLFFQNFLKAGSCHCQIPGLFPGFPWSCKHCVRCVSKSFRERIPLQGVVNVITRRIFMADVLCSLPPSVLCMIPSTLCVFACRPPSLCVNSFPHTVNSGCHLQKPSAGCLISVVQVRLVLHFLFSLPLTAPLGNTN